MPHALPAIRPTRRLVALLFALLALGAVGLSATPAPATAQLIDNTPQTKEEARALRDATDKADDGGSVPISVWLGLGALAAIGGAAFLILRDAGTVANVDERRRAPAAPPVDRSTTRGVPGTMFEGESSSANPRGKAKKRVKAKRQKQARRANRPKR